LETFADVASPMREALMIHSPPTRHDQIGLMKRDGTACRRENGPASGEDDVVWFLINDLLRRVGA
jgi:hypothetical protein